MKLTIATIAAIIIANAPAFAASLSDCAVKPIEGSNAVQFVDPACPAAIDGSKGEDRSDKDEEGK